MKIISFNINGMRARPHQLEKIKKKYDPDVIALQEIKVSDEDFPPEIPESLGFKYLTEIGTISICNSYFPQGENRKHPLKFPYKDRYYKRITEYLSGLDNHIVLTGDFNIAPNRNDIGMNEDGIKRWLREGHTAFLPEELEWYEKLTNIGLKDVWREKNSESLKCTWFDYRSRGFDQNPKRGLRIDHFLLSEGLQDKYVSSEIDHEIRAMEKPSDHCPVSLEIKV